jgi:hypothetical protein
MIMQMHVAWLTRPLIKLITDYCIRSLVLRYKPSPTI